MIIRNSTNMRARFAWLTSSAASLEAARPVFAAAGYTLVEPREGGAFDMVVVDLRDGSLPVKRAVEIAASVRRQQPDCAIVYAGGVLHGDADRAHLRRTGEFVLCDEDLHAVVSACRNRLRVRNIAEETGERLKSIAASTRLSEFPPIETSNSAPRVLIAGAPGPAAAAALHAVESVAESVSAVFNAGQAIRALESGAFDCAVFTPTFESDPLVALSRSMRRHRQLQDIPVVLVAPQSMSRKKLAAAAASDCLPPELAMSDLPARVLSLVRRARLVAAMRTFLNACAGDGVRDRLSGVFAPQFFALHAERVFACAERSGRPAALVGLRLAPPASDAETVTSVRTLTDAARLIGRVTRAEDCAARISSDTFAVMMSATTGADAMSAARRIEGVIANTMFRLRGEKRLFAVAAATAAVEHAAGRRFEETLAALLVQLNGASPRTAER